MLEGESVCLHGSSRDREEEGRREKGRAVSGEMNVVKGEA